MLNTQVYIFSCENGYSMETTIVDGEGGAVIKRYVGTLEDVLRISKEFFLEEI